MITFKTFWKEEFVSPTFHPGIQIKFVFHPTFRKMEMMSLKLWIKLQHLLEMNENDIEELIIEHEMI